MADQRRPTARDLAGSAVDLNGYAVLFEQLARQADEDGMVKVPAARLVHISTFMGRVVDELLALIPPDDVDDTKNT
jgi:hypothetical protein